MTNIWNRVKQENDKYSTAVKINIITEIHLGMK